MPAPRTAAPMRAAVSTVLMLILAVVGQSCGPAEPEFDRSALYTPEALAGELILRFQRLNPDARATTVRYQPRVRQEGRRAAGGRRSGQEQGHGRRRPGRSRPGSRPSTTCSPTSTASST